MIVKKKKNKQQKNEALWQYKGKQSHYYLQLT